MTDPIRLNGRWASSMRQEILDTLDEARASDVAFSGGSSGVITTRSGAQVDRACTAAGWIPAGYAAWVLPAGIYDMRQSLRFLAERHRRIESDGSVSKGFAVQFSKAVRILCDRGELIAEDPDLPNVTQRRFVRRGDEPWPGWAQASPTQRAIMTTLDDAKSAGLSVRGNVDGIVGCHPGREYWRRYQDAGWDKIDNQHWRLPADVYDLRVSLAYVRERDPGCAGMFSGAVRHLCASGALICDAPDLPKLKQRRFVKRGRAQPAKPATPNSPVDPISHTRHRPSAIARYVP